ncbi:hypothetical protein SAMN04490181_0400 [Pseudomonas brenneri]|uniref:Uncharacterized protein n=1 Tax=Pseudomonas brenneri TaxID=129817 RepID=A0ABY0W7S2_9PSED|nr:hypothetical protein SAMN04490181_0400 [Pseudomonas brenneri]
MMLGSGYVLCKPARRIECKTELFVGRDRSLHRFLYFNGLAADYLRVVFNGH